MHIYDDTYYIDQVLQGNVNAYSHLVDRHKAMAYTLALKLVQVPEDAEEIAQDGFVKAFRSLKDFKGECKFSTWLYRIVYNLAISSLRKKRLEMISIEANPNHFSDIRETEHFLNRLTTEEQNRTVRTAIGKLPPEDRALIILFYMNDNSVKEIALITGLSLPNVRIKLFRARKRLWDMLKDCFTGEKIVHYEERE